MIICSPKNIICLSIWPNLILHFLHIGPMPFLIKCFLSIFGFVLVWMEFSNFLFWIITAIQRYSYTFPNYARTEMNQRNAKYITKGQKNEENKEVLKDKTEKRSAIRLSVSATSLPAKPIYLNQRHGTFQHGRGVRWKDHAPPQKHIKFTSACETIPTECWQQTVGFQKGKPISSEWSRAKNKDKKETKDFGTGTCTPGTELWRRKSLHTLRNPLMGGGKGGASESQRGAQQQLLGRQNGKNSSQRSMWNSTSQHAHRSEWGPGAEVQASGVRPQGEDRGWLPWTYVLIQHSWGSPGKSPVPPRGKRSLSQRPSDSVSLQTTVTHLSECHKWNK